jgi:hypothetical protein
MPHQHGERPDGYGLAAAAGNRGSAIMLLRFWQGKGEGLVVTVAKVAALVAFLSLAAVNWLSGSLVDGHLAQLARAAADRQDPIVTGSLASQAGIARLDPCGGEFKR